MEPGHSIAFSKQMIEIALALLPLALLLASLLLGLYPGCEAIVRLSERIAAPSRRPRPRRQSRPKAPRSRAASGGLLIALGHAQRPPPLLA
jgi:hypothetical protein